MVYFGYQAKLQGKNVYSNFYTSFSEILTLNEIIDMFKNRGLQNAVIMLDEAQVYLSNTGEKAVVIKELINLFIAQTRKRGVDIYLTTQRYANLHKQLRVQVDIILSPIKTHHNGTECTVDNCDQDHYIHVYRAGNPEAIITLDAQKVGKLYDTNEIVLDYFRTPAKEKSPQKQAISLLTD